MNTNFKKRKYKPRKTQLHTLYEKDVHMQINMIVLI